MFTYKFPYPFTIKHYYFSMRLCMLQAGDNIQINIAYPW